MNGQTIAQMAFEEGRGVLRLAPAWVPRSFCRPGRRLRLHPDDTYACGLGRGGIDERWIASTVSAANGPDAPESEGQSDVVADEGGKARVPLREAVQHLKGDAVGEDIWQAHHGWPVFAKFFDNYDSLALHLHHGEAAARRVNQNSKPEMYFFPAQMNNYVGAEPMTYFGLLPETAKEQVRACLAAFEKGDNGILALSRAFRLELDTGWDVPCGVLHAPGSLCTYEPQFASDIGAVFQSVLHRDRTTDPASLWMNCPPEEVGNLDYLMSLLDWDANVDPDFHKNRMMRPRPVRPVVEMEETGAVDEWICYRNAGCSARRLTVWPGRRTVLRDGAAAGLICIQGYGAIGGQKLESPTLLRYGQLTHDEYFITAKAAQEGVEIVNESSTEPLVLLRNFAGRPGGAIE